MPEDTTSLSLRLCQLERRSRRQRAALTALAVLGFACGALSLAAPSQGRYDVLETGELRVTDGSGRVRATLWTEGDESGLDVFDEHGARRATLLAGVKESLLTFFDETGEDRMTLVQGFNDHGLYLMDAQGRDRLSLYAFGEEESVNLRGRADGSKIALSLSEADHGLYLIRGGHDRVSLLASGKDEGLFFREDRGLYAVPGSGEGKLQLVTD